MLSKFTGDPLHNHCSVLQIFARQTQSILAHAHFNGGGPAKVEGAPGHLFPVTGSSPSRL